MRRGLMKGGCRKCSICGETFMARTANQKYCSDPCRRMAEGKSTGLEEWRKGCKCVVCGKKFIPKSSRQKCCSPSCMEVNSKGLQVRWRRRRSNPESVPVENENGNEYGPDIEQYSRTCHDCGKPTNDYRCASCRRKWLEKNKAHCV